MALKFQQIEDCPICAGKTRAMGWSARFYAEPFDTIIEQCYRFCDDCLFGFTENPLSRQDLDEYYAKASRYLPMERRYPDLRHASEQADFALRFVDAKNDFRFLEIGPLIDNFLSAVLLKSGGEGYYSELNEKAVERLSRQKYKSFDWDEATRFHLIGMRHVLEHIVEPISFLERLAKSLENDGVLFFEVPDLSTPNLPFVDGLRFEHVNYFSATAALRIAAMAGFYVAGLESTRVPASATSSNQVMRVALKKLPDDEMRIDLSQHLYRSLEIVDIVRKAVTKAGPRYAIYGVGTMAEAILPYLDGHHKPVQLFDGNSSKQGRTVLGLEIEAPGVIDPGKFDCLLVTVMGPQDIVRNLLDDCGVPKHKMLWLSDLIQAQAGS